MGAARVQTLTSTQLVNSQVQKFPGWRTLRTVGLAIKFTLGEIHVSCTNEQWVSQLIRWQKTGTRWTSPSPYFDRKCSGRNRFAELHEAAFYSSFCGHLTYTNKTDTSKSHIWCSFAQAPDISTLCQIKLQWLREDSTDIRDKVTAASGCLASVKTGSLLHSVQSTHSHWTSEPLLLTNPHKAPSNTRTSALQDQTTEPGIYSQFYDYRNYKLIMFILSIQHILARDQI